MPRSAQLYLGDLLEMCRRIRDYTAADGRTVDAVLRNLEIAGEAVKNLPPEVLARAPEVPWQKVVRLRDLLAHAYHRIETAVIWRIVQDDVPVLEAVARR